MPKKSPRVAWIAGGVVVALLAGVGVMWLVLGDRVESLEQQVTELEASAEATASDEASDALEATQANVPEVQQPFEQPVEQPVAQPGAAEPAREESTGPNEVQPAYVQSLVNDGGTWKLKVDYIQFLTGGEAADAAAAHGDESPPPNDYYVVNDNPKIREFPVQAGISPVVVTTNDGYSDPGGHALSLSQWASALNGPSGPVFRSTIYWVTVTNGTVTAINAQYTP